MGYLRTRRDGSFFAGRGAILAGIVGLHGVAIVGLSHLGVGPRFLDPAPAVEVAFIEERTPKPAVAQVPVKLADVRPVDIVVPVVDLPSEAPTPTAITVSPPPKAQPAAAPVTVMSDMPVSIDGADYLRPPSPRYPVAAKRARVQGVVLLRVLIDREGRPCEVRVHRSSGSEQLDAAARESVLQALFKPYRENGESRSAQVIIPIEFSLTIRTAARS
jgi:protein TonB